MIGDGDVAEQLRGACCAVLDGEVEHRFHREAERHHANGSHILLIATEGVTDPA